MPTRTHLLKVHKEILTNVKKELHSYIGKTLPSLEHYYKDYQKEFHPHFKTSSKKELLSQIKKNDIIYSGDYHTFAQSQKIPLRLLRELIKKRKKIIIAMEMMMSEHQDILDRYMSGFISEKIFLQSIYYERLWSFEWKHFKPIFDFAKFHHLKIVGLNCKAKGIEGNLEKRDRWAAQIIADLTLKYRKHLIYVIFGDLHLAQKHLPFQVDQLLKSHKTKRKKLIIYQNNENLYWQLAKKGMEHKVDVVRLSPHAYCITNAVPWVKLQSYLHWIENIDFHDQIYGYINSLCHFLKIPTKRMDQFDIYTREESSDLEMQLNSLEESKRQISWYRKIIQNSESTFIPNKNILYLRKMSHNHAAEEASIFVYLNITKGYMPPISIEEFFYQNLILRTIGYLGSKILNPKRVCESKQDFKQILKKKQTVIPLHFRNKIKIAQALLPYFQREKKFLHGKKFNATITGTLKSDICLAYEVSKALGHCLGEKFYHALHEEKISKKELNQMFMTAFEPDEALEIYLSWLKRLESIKLHYQSRIDHL